MFFYFCIEPIETQESVISFGSLDDNDRTQVVDVGLDFPTSSGQDQSQSAASALTTQNIGGSSPLKFAIFRAYKKIFIYIFILITFKLYKI